MIKITKPEDLKEDVESSFNRIIALIEEKLTKARKDKDGYNIRILYEYPTATVRTRIIKTYRDAGWWDVHIAVNEDGFVLLLNKPESYEKGCVVL